MKTKKKPKQRCLLSHVVKRAWHPSPPNLNSVVMTSLSMDVRLWPSWRHNSIIFFRDILSCPVLSYTENATLYSVKQQKLHKLKIYNKPTNEGARQVVLRLNSWTVYAHACNRKTTSTMPSKQFYYSLYQTVNFSYRNKLMIVDRKFIYRLMQFETKWLCLNLSS